MLLHFVYCYPTSRKTSVLGVEFFQRNEGNSRIRPGGTGVSPRIDSRERREAVFVDGLLGIDGIPIGLEGRGSVEKWEWEGREEIISSGTQQRLKMCARLRILSASYVSIMLLVGIIWQEVFR